MLLAIAQSRSASTGTIAISADEIKFIGTAADEAGELLADHLGDDEPTTIKELQEAMGEDAPTQRHYARRSGRRWPTAGPKWWPRPVAGGVPLIGQNKGSLLL